MAGDLYELLELPRDADGNDIDRAYWAHARALGAAARVDHRASARLDDLNAAYQAFTQADTLRVRKRQKARRKALRKRLAKTLMAVVVIGAGAVVGWSLRSDLATLSADTGEKVQQAAGDAADWVRSLDETPSTGTYYLIANTGGEGAYIRTAPGYSAPGIVAHPDGTGVASSGERAEVEGETWLRVQDAQGNVGWISDRWLSPVQ